MKEQIIEIAASVFEVDVKDISEKSSPNELENWDSITQMNLIVTIEETFDIEFDDDDVMNIENIQSIIEIASSKS